MKSSFYNRTAYILPNMPAVPQCFRKLDEYFDTKFTSAFSAMTNPSVILAENLCRRMADVELYANYISEAQKGLNTLSGAILIGTLLVGYFTACKSLLDAGSITLAKVYNLTLTNREMDFSKSKFWRQLDKEAGATISGRYAPFKGLFNEIVDWRDSAVHRITPFTLTHSPGDPFIVPRETQVIKMVAKPDVNISTVVASPQSVAWVEPLHYHKQWQSQLIEFCKEVCLDIRSQTFT
jgi:hypothetical protein